MTEQKKTKVAARLAKRVGRPLPEIAPVRFDDTPIPGGLLDHLRAHLNAGETHYTARPGIPELRSAICRAIHESGGPDRDSESAIITHGEGEALYVTLLGLGLGAGSRIVVSGGCKHRALLDLLEISITGPGDPRANDARASYREHGVESRNAGSSNPEDRIDIIALGGWLFSADSRSSQAVSLPDDAILIGHLDGVPGLDHFHLGFVAGPPDVVKQIQTWKQALSICTAGPSQQAALYAIGEGGAS